MCSVGHLKFPFENLKLIIVQIEEEKEKQVRYENKRLNFVFIFSPYLVGEKWKIASVVYDVDSMDSCAGSRGVAVPSSTSGITRDGLALPHVGSSWVHSLFLICPYQCFINLIGY